MNKRVFQKLSAWQYIGLVALVLLPALAYLGLLDRLSSEQVGSSIRAASIVYGTARGIDALVSLLQGTEFNLVFITISIGEVLDPVNDLIEQFSDIMLFALGSLALQKILLTIVSHQGFNILLFGLAVCTGIALFQRNTRVWEFLWRSFLIIAFLRFSLGIVVLANGWVDTHFLHKADELRHKEMQVFQDELREARSLTSGKKDYSEATTMLTKDIAQKDRSLSPLENEIARIEPDIKTAKRKIDELKEKSGVLCKTLPINCSKEVKAAQDQLASLEEEMEILEADYAHSLSILETKKEELDCLNKHQRGESCSFLDHFSRTPNLGDLQARIEKIDRHVGAFVGNAINLLTSILLKSLIIPLLFFYFLLKLARALWR